MSKRSLIDSIEVKNACSEDWDKMTGTERVRFCSHCALEVNNISTLTRKQAMKLVRESNGRICVRYIKNPVDNSPVFAEKLYQITRRASIAAGVLSVTLSLSTVSYAQGRAMTIKTKTEISQKESAEKDKIESATATIKGLITDSFGAVIPKVNVTITNLKTDARSTVAADEEGIYKFENIPIGKYKVAAAYAGFKAASTEIDVFDEKENVADISLEPGGQMFTMGEVAILPYSNPLSTAVSDNSLEKLLSLIPGVANVNQKEKNYSNITALFLAVENGNAETAETLLNYGAKVNAKDNNKQTPLMRLDEDASVELVNLLIKHGAKVNLTDKDGNTALILAARSVTPEVLQVLITHTAALNAQNREGRTALMEAADADNLENVRALILAGADVNLKDNDGETAFDLTTDEEIEKLLEEYGALSGDDFQ
jgi:hypothetical protein